MCIYNSLHKYIIYFLFNLVIHLFIYVLPYHNNFMKTCQIGHNHVQVDGPRWI